MQFVYVWNYAHLRCLVVTQPGGARERTLIDGINKLDMIEKDGMASASQNPVMESAGETVGISEQKGSGSKFGSVSISIDAGGYQ